MSIHEVYFENGEVIKGDPIDEAIKIAAERGVPFPNIYSARTIYDGSDSPNETPASEITRLIAETPDTVALEIRILKGNAETGHPTEIVVSRVIFTADQINGIKAPFMQSIPLMIGTRGFAWSETPEKQVSKT